MKILHVMPYSPLPMTSGGAIRIYHMLRTLAYNNDVSVIAFGTSADREEILRHFGTSLSDVRVVGLPWVNNHRRLTQLFALCSRNSFFRISTRSEEMQRAISEFLLKNDVEVIQTEFPLMAQYDYPSEAFKILDAHNVEYENFRRWYELGQSPIRKLHYLREFNKVRREELEVCRKQDLMFVTSAPDMAIFDRDIPDVPKVVIPNGVDTTYFTPTGEATEPFSMVFTGIMSYLPNNDAMMYFLDEILPLINKRIPEAKIYIVGDRPPRALTQRCSSRVIVTGFVDQVRPYVARSTVYVVPLRMGSGTRLKILEALAMKKPIVTTSIGCEGIDVTDQESVLIADDPQAFADSVVRLMHDAPLRARLTESGYELVRLLYDWSVIGRRTEDAYSLLSHRHSMSAREAV